MKTERLYMRLTKETKSKIERISKEENRSMSNWIESVILEKLEENGMNNLEGKKVKELSKEERKYLETIISGDYRGIDNKLKEGKNEVTIDFENGLSVAGWIINTEEEIYYELDEEGIIYDPSK